MTLIAKAHHERNLRGSLSRAQKRLGFLNSLLEKIAVRWDAYGSSKMPNEIGAVQVDEVRQVTKRYVLTKMLIQTVPNGVHST